MTRGVMEWSQEALAEISGLTVRSIQRTEAGQQVNTDTKRAIARAFGCDDLNFLMQPITASSPKSLKPKKRPSPAIAWCLTSSSWMTAALSIVY